MPNLDDLRRRIIDGEEISREELKQAIALKHPAREEALAPKAPKKRSKKTFEPVDLSDLLD